MLKLKLQYFDAKSRLIGKDPDAGKDWRQEEKGMTEDEMVGWHHQLNGHEFEQTLGDCGGQGILAWCSPRGCKESLLDWTLESPQQHSHKTRRTLMSPQERKIDWCTPTQDEAHFPFIESIAVSHSTSYTTSVLTSFTTIQIFPETPISSL